MNHDEVDEKRRRFLTTAVAVVGGAGAVAASVPFVAYLKPSERTRAVGGPVEIDIGKLKPGERMIAKWRGRPIWIVHRSRESLAALESMESKVADPMSEDSEQPEYARNALRSRRPEYLVVEGLCTHLGCSPTYIPADSADAPEPGWKGGFLCPCHGSKFDLAGRVFRDVPAPTNLPVPPHHYMGDTRLLIGADEAQTG